MMWIKEPKTKEPSVTLTLLVLTWIVGIINILLSNNTILHINFNSFNGVDFGALMASMSSIYGVRKYQENQLKLSGANEKTNKDEK